MVHDPVHVAYPVQAEPGSGKQSGAARAERRGGGVWVLMAWGLLPGAMEMCWNHTVTMAAQHCECTETQWSGIK